MPITYNCNQVGQNALWNKSAFEGREIRIHPDRIHCPLDAETYKSLQIFHTKKAAKEFLKNNNISGMKLEYVSSRFQRGVAINMGRYIWMPDHAQALIIARELGCVITSIEDNRMWPCQN